MPEPISRPGLRPRIHGEIPRVIVTGGAGFVGSNLVRRLVASGRRVRILDDLSTGARRNIDDVGDGAEFVLGDVRDLSAVREAVRGVDVVYHLAALPAVARSIEDPIAADGVNAGGTLNVLVASRDEGVRRVVYASSSSVYGDTPVLPKHEAMPVDPRSPYAASKLAGEAHCRAFARTYGLQTISLRFFNIFGPRQDPTSDYAAVIPRFVSRMLAGGPPIILGDGSQSRDFTFVANAVEACVLAAEAGSGSAGEVMNVGCGVRSSLHDLVAMINSALGTSIDPVFKAPRPGDVTHSLASLEQAGRLIGYRPLVRVREGLAQTIGWMAAARPEIA